ncbi:type I restriction enzyme HsdR N-terminal domain-containing protein [Desulfocurvibacter africanus]|uniref:Restriction endonuclease, type I, EcoRI, R subunit/Type III n=1 Tax=Desulfocurvibacter africanus subsp. africanus str. Walvis Bay TaxID=690850 RepID=F3Z2V0_DESAF|nr:type I restriction enzyme HsdR N-terminal domain-containing protein [Desulfocurvibacter africanus]EGJ50267.1 Restriction endonuclease, type I, EcoRI, R subunit/Type III [Desulfocurvibacter africanus subsp. africanus str. Walvis Bay]
MEFSNKLREFAGRIEVVKTHLTTEEGTKTSLVMPFLQLLGYNVFDPTEVTPEFIADVGTKKGEKVDYAIKRDGQPIVLIECKPLNSPLETCQCNQLRRYFQSTNARIGVLTDGVRYLFFTDLDKSNIMDNRPFMEFSLAEIDDGLLPELRKLCKDSWDLDATLSAATELKYMNQLKRVIAQELQEPSDGLVRHFASQVYEGQLRQDRREFFAKLLKRAFKQHINEELKSSVNSLIATRTEQDQPQEPETPSSIEAQAGRLIVTSDEEKEGYLIVKAILRDTVDVSRVAMRDTQSYCGILLDDINRKPLCRLHFNGRQKYLGLIVDKDKKEDRVTIESLDDIYTHADRIRAAVDFYQD